MTKAQNSDEIEVGWAEAYGGSSRGIDHLGVRTAGEVAYARLLDFVTTVSWRPRYLSMLCWALERAWSRHAKERPDGTAEVDRTAWRACVRRADHLAAAATLATTPSVARINGVTAISAALNTGDDFELDRSYAQTSSLGLYNGVLRALGLARERGGFDALTERGKDLAGMFGSVPDLEAIADSESVTRATLERLGRAINLTQIPEQEAQLLRERTMRWEAVGQDHATGWAGQTVGLLLRFQELLGGHGGVDEFRSAIVAGSVSSELLLPEGAQLPVAKRWSAYQAHANAAYALEVLFAAYLELGSGRLEVDHEAIVGRCVRAVREAGLSGPLSALVPASPHIVQPQLVSKLKTLDGALIGNLGEALHAAVELFVAAVSHLRNPDISAGWVGPTQSDRLPPSELVSWLDALSSADAVSATVTLLERSIHQHERTALRKLMNFPELDTIKLLREGSQVRVLNRHRPDHSYPRFLNAMVYLTDLGLLDSAGKPTAIGAKYQHAALRQEALV